jgi:hypothetical protein
MIHHPEGVKQTNLSGNHLQPFQGINGWFALSPRVLPWAKLFDAFGVEASTASANEMDYLDPIALRH